MIELVVIGALVLGTLAAVLPPLAGAMYKRKAYRLLAQANPSPSELRMVIGGLSRSKDAEAKRLGDDLHAKLRQVQGPYSS